MEIKKPKKKNIKNGGNNFFQESIESGTIIKNNVTPSEFLKGEDRFAIIISSLRD
jgi:hypothetical protein